MAKVKKTDTLTLEEQLEQALVPEGEQPYPIPDNWCWVKLGFILTEIKNGTTIKQDKGIQGFRVTRIESLQNQTIDFCRLGIIINESEIKDSDWYNTGDIALSHINSAEHVGKTAIITKDMLPLVHGMNLLRLRFRPYCIPTFFQYYSQSYQYKAGIISRINMSVNQVSINQKQLSSMEFPLPPLAEQKRIVERIESLFAKLDKAKEKTQAALDSFETRKTAILHKAFTGELTAKWREENGISLESWEVVYLQNVCEINPKKIDTNKLLDDTEVSFIPMSCVSDELGTVINFQTKYLNKVKKGYTNFIEDDIIFAKITPCMENGKSAIIGKLTNNIGFGSTEFHVLRCGSKLYNRFLYYIVRSQKFRDEAKAVMAGAVGQQRVPKDFIEKYSIILPSLSEQTEIVRLLDNFFAKEQRAKELCSILDKIDLIKKSILARAFRGKLGTNDPNDENAVELLKQCLQQDKA